MEQPSPPGDTLSQQPLHTNGQAGVGLPLGPPASGLWLCTQRSVHQAWLARESLQPFLMAQHRLEAVTPAKLSLTFPMF